MKARDLIEDQWDDELSDWDEPSDAPRRCPHCTDGRISRDGARSYRCPDCHGSGFVPDEDQDEMKVQVSDGADWGEPIAWSEFVTLNQDGIGPLEFSEIEQALTRGEVYQGGGGAAAEWSVRRVTESDEDYSPFIADTQRDHAAERTRRTQECPECGSDDVSRRHHRGNALAPECHWWECNNCGHKSDPE